MFSFATSAFAAQNPVGIDSNKGETVLLDVFIADHYKMAAYTDDDTAWVFTVFDDGSIEVASSPIDGSGIVRSVWLSTEDLSYTSQRGGKEIFEDLAYFQAVKEYSLDNIDMSEEMIVTQVNRSPESQRGMAVTTSGTDDYNALMAQLEAIHGPQHYDYNWTGMSSQLYNGYTLNYKEILTYGMTYRDSYYFSQGMTLGGIVAGLVGLFVLSVPMWIIATVLGVAAYYNTYLDHSGYLAAYYGDAVYYRYVLVNGSGPYYECSKITYYDGWVEEGMYNSARLVDGGTIYTPTSQIFGSYTMQRTRALENY